MNATTWQDNMGGSDMTYGDAGGLQEPYSYWEFRLLEKKYLLLPEPNPQKVFYVHAWPYLACYLASGGLRCF